MASEHGVNGVPLVRAVEARPYPKIELHVHLEGTLRPATLLRLAGRNGVRLPADTAEGLRDVLRFTDFPHFIEAWIATSQVLRHYDDFRMAVVDYAAQVAPMGCVYLEGIFSPAEPVRRGAEWQQVFEGYCDGGAEARERHGVEVRLTPDVTRNFPPEEGEEVARWAVRYRDRGVVGLGLGGSEDLFPPEPFAPAFAVACAGGLGSVPHAGELAGPASVRGALEALHADRLRHGVRAVEDAGLLRELADRRICCDVTPIGNLRMGVIASLAEHPLPRLAAAGVPCSISTDDPALMDTSLEEDCAAAEGLGLRPRDFYFAAVEGALCDAATRARLRAIGEAFDWSDGPGADSGAGEGADA
jgi:aminodeoxyfutalosine deaminase